jgi:hypothetical protein
MDEGTLGLYDALGAAEKAHAALESELKKVPTDRLAATDPRVVRMNQLADDIESLEKAVFPNGRPR